MTLSFKNVIKKAICNLSKEINVMLYFYLAAQTQGMILYHCPEQVLVVRRLEQQHFVVALLAVQISKE